MVSESLYAQTALSSVICSRVTRYAHAQDYDSIHLLYVVLIGLSSSALLHGLSTKSAQERVLSSETCELKPA